MHLFARWQHLSLDLDAKNLGVTCAGSPTGSPVTNSNCFFNNKFGKNVGGGFEDLDIFQVGGVIFF